ncbi:MAG: error-prone DNA polymerase [Ilumatobacteraceae bacterium]
MGDDPSYGELHCKSNFSFLLGASHPEQLVDRAVQLGLRALALTDRNGLYGVVRFAQAARAVGLPTVFGAEIECANGDIVILAKGPQGYAKLSSAITAGQLAGKKLEPVFTLAGLASHGGGHWRVLTGSRSGVVARAFYEHGPAAAEREVQQLVSAFGRDHVFVELWDHGDPLDSVRNDALVRIAHHNNVQCVATNAVLYAVTAQYQLATAIAAVRERRSLDDIDHELPPAGAAYLRSGAEQQRHFARYPGVVNRAAELSAELAFDLALVAPSLPPFRCPDGMDEMSYLRQLVEQGATRRYGSRPTVTHDDLSLRARAWHTIDHELEVIDTLGFAGYFLVVWDIVQFCERANIFCQGRGSAANSAVCFSIGITKADAVSLGLLFERFLSPERDGPPDIDIDIESGRREEVIQYVFERYDRHHAAQVANVITYRARSAVRDMARALGFAPGQQDAWSKRVDGWGSLSSASGASDHSVPAAVMSLALQIEDAPRHLGIHSGGMVICDRPVSEVCPVEWARMENRSVLQWDKDDCAAAGLVKFDLLGLGMLSALHNAVDLIGEFRNVQLDLAEIPQEDDVYAMLCRADTIGVFQIESRAQMSTLPRLKPRRFYDLVVEVALIRPGPIQGDSVHPYIRRRNGQEPVTYLHPLLENSLGKTLGVPLFQEQLMQMAIDVAGFTPNQADELRQAMGSKRSHMRMEKLRERMYAGMSERGITGNVADLIYEKMAAFANFGFPESHSVSFAYLVYSSAWIKFHEPAVFYTSLLNAQPMGFWSPHSLVGDARRHGVVVLTPDINASLADATLEQCADSAGGLAVRLGIGSVRGIGDTLAQTIQSGRPYVDMEDLVRRSPQLHIAQLEAMATAGAFTQCFNLQRRDALWAAGAVIQSHPDRLAGVTTGVGAPHLPGMQPVEEAIADMWATGIAPNGHPTQFLRAELTRMGVVTAEDLWNCDRDSKVLVAGIVTHRQRPATSRGVTFMNLEDETGHVNIVVSEGCWVRYRHEARGATALLLRGRLEANEGVINVIAEHMKSLIVGVRASARNFR